MNFISATAATAPLDAELGDDFDPSPAPADALSPLRDLVAHLRGASAGRARVGFLGHAPQSEDDWREVAARVSCEIAFLPQLWLARLPDGARFASISSVALLAALDEIAQSSGSSDVVLIVGLDLLLTRLNPNECTRFWDDLPARLPHRPRALITALPHAFARFGPDAGAWEKMSARMD